MTSSGVGAQKRFVQAERAIEVEKVCMYPVNNLSKPPNHAGPPKAKPDKEPDHNHRGVRGAGSPPLIAIFIAIFVFTG